MPGRVGHARCSEHVGLRRSGRGRPAPLRRRSGRTAVGRARSAGQRRVPRRPRVPAPRDVPVSAGGRARRPRIGARRRSTRVPLRGTVPCVDRVVRRHRSRDVDGRTHRRQFRRIHRRRFVHGRGDHGRAAVGAGHVVPGGGRDARSLHRGQVHGRPSSRAAVPHRSNLARRRRAAHVHRERAAHPPPGHPRHRRVLGPRVAVGAVPERSRLRVHRLSTASRRQRVLQRGLPLHGRWCARPRQGETGAVAHRSALRTATTPPSCWSRSSGSRTSKARRSCRPTSSASPRYRSSRCSSRAALATAGTARRRTGCSNVRRRGPSSDSDEPPSRRLPGVEYSCHSP